MRSTFLYFCLSLLFGKCTSQASQNAWTAPADTEHDFTVTLRRGQTVPISWTGWESSWIDKHLSNKKINDLWVTSFEYHVAPFQRLLAEGIDISQAGSYTWGIDIPHSSLSRTAKYVFRFKNPASPRNSYDHASGQLASRGFFVVGDGASHSMKVIVNVTSTSYTISASREGRINLDRVRTSSTPTPVALALAQEREEYETEEPEKEQLETYELKNDEPDEDDEDDKGLSELSTGVKIGVCVGTSIGGVLVTVLTVFACAWRRRHRSSGSEMDYSTEYPPPEPPAYYYGKSPTSASLSTPPVEAPVNVK